MAYEKNLVDRFWSKVDIRGPEECWKWKSDKDRKGYGRFKLDGDKKYAHRISWVLTNGPIPEGKLILHKCDNKECENPSHLYIGTQGDNMRDREQRGSKTHGRPSKLGSHRMLELRALWKSGKYKQWELANLFGLSISHISHLVTGICGDYTIREKPYER